MVIAEIHTENRTLNKKITINLQNLSLISDTPMENTISFEPSVDTQKYQSNFTTTPQNQTHWELLAENGSVLINTTLPNINKTLNRFFFYFLNPILGRGYVVVNDEWGGIFSNATVFTITFSSNEIRKSIVLWEWSEEPVTVFPQEGLLKKRAGCCYCVDDYYYRFSLDHGLEYLTKTYLWSSTVLDLRTKQIIMVHSINNKIEVVDYNLTQPARKRSTRFNESNLESFIKDTSTTSYSSWLDTWDIIFSGILIFVIKNISQKWKLRRR